MGRFVRRRTSSHLAYRLDVDDLKHWEVAAHLIIVFVWDVRRRSGVWLSVPEIIKQLQRASRRWRSQKTVTVSFPLTNGTDDVSLQRLRHLVADHNAPIVKKGKNHRISASFAFPASAEGRAAAAALNSALDLGERARIDGKYIAKWRMPAWWERLYGKARPEHVTIGPSPGTSDIPTRLEVDTPSGVHTVDVELRQQRAGRRGFLLASDGRSPSVHVTLEGLREGDGIRLNLNLKVEHIVEDIFEARRATELVIALRVGSRFRLVQRRTGGVLAESDVPAAFAAADLEDLREWKAFVDKLCFIQGRIRKHGLLKIPKGGVTRANAAACERLYEILTTGRLKRQVTFSGEIDLTKDAMKWRRIVDDRKPEEPFELGIDVGDAGTLKILNVVVPLGRLKARHDASGVLPQVEDALRAGRRSVKFSVPEVEISEEYLDWSVTSPLTETRHAQT